MRLKKVKAGLSIILMALITIASFNTLMIIFYKDSKKPAMPTFKKMDSKMLVTLISKKMAFKMPAMPTFKKMDSKKPVKLTFKKIMDHSLTARTKMLGTFYKSLS